MLSSRPLALLGAVVCLGACSAEFSVPIGAIEAPSQVAVGAVVALDGGGSRDPDGRALSFHWRLIEVPPGSQAALNGAGLVSPSFVADVPGPYQIGLAVSNGVRRAPEVLRRIEAGPCGGQAPVIEALSAVGPVRIGRPVALEALALDPDDSPGCGGDQADPALLSALPGLRPAWRLVSKPEGSQATLNDPGISRPSFTPDLAGDYEVELVLADGSDRVSAPARLAVAVGPCGGAAPRATVSASPAAPGAGATIALQATVEDADNAEGCDAGQTFSYRWILTALPAGSAARLNAADAATPSFVADRPGAYTVRLQVTDSAGLSSAPVDTQIAVSDCGANPPVISALDASPVSPNAGQAVQLEARLSDADTDEACGLTERFTHRWALVALPAGSAAALNDPGARNPSFFTDRPGTYTVQLVVDDAFGNVSAPFERSFEIGACGTAAPSAVVSVAPDAPGVGDLVALAATISDADTEPPCALSETFTQRWSFVAVPEGSAAHLPVPGSRTVGFIADVPGDYTVRLVVQDRSGLQSAPVDTTVTVSACGDAAPTVQGVTFGPARIGAPVALSATAADADNAAGCGLDQALSSRTRRRAAPPRSTMGPWPPPPLCPTSPAPTGSASG